MSNVNRNFPNEYPWDEWEDQALAAGVHPDLAALGRAVFRDQCQHDWNKFYGEVGPSAAEIMIDLALKNPARAKERWTYLLQTDGERIKV